MPKLIDNKEQGIRITGSVLLSWLGVGAAFWAVGEPLLVSAVSVAIAEDVQTQVQAEAAPIKSAFSVLILRDMTQLRQDIAALEFRRDNPPGEDWTAQDALELVNRRLDLESLRMALTALNAPVE